MQMVLYLLSSTVPLNDVLRAQISLTHKMTGLSILSWVFRLQSVMYTDFAKAFDTVFHNRLFVKLHAYGISVRGKFLLWLLKFFSDRTHAVRAVPR